MRAIGLLESFSLSEEVGKNALAFEELVFMGKCKKKKGCRLKKDELTPEEKNKVLALGRKCWKWKEQNR